MNTKKTVFRKDYTPPKYLVNSIELTFELAATETIVSTTMLIQANHRDAGELVLNGEKQELLDVKLNDQPLSDKQYLIKDGLLTIHNAPGEFKLSVKSKINPQENTALEGLYRSSGIYCTQCEPEGFRRITFFPDRPDIMTIFTVTMIGDEKECPVMLSNGNLIEEKTLGNGRKLVRWHDPHPKPSYLFAVVAGNLLYIKDEFTTASGKKVDLFIYVEEQNIDKCQHAMQSLKKAMQWDEEKYGREYDLERYMIVAVDDFNMGAMENKGLNVFNSRYVLAKAETATDQDYEGIEGVIAHEYFHNWTGNRITCRDWFQLSLKEGLTVFRDQQFSGDMGSAAVKRIEDISIIRNHQFKEDSGPMAHPIRPDSFVEINNFYTLTVYNKGAEVIRMLHTILGEKGFRKGMDLYFARHDSQAVTCEDFIKAMEDANQQDLNQFREWYRQAGTPQIEVNQSYNHKDNTLSLEISQKNPPVGKEKKEKPPLDIPIKINLLDQSGGLIRNDLLRLREQKEQFSFKLDEKKQQSPIIALPGNFSAPIKVKIERTKEELAITMKHAPDHFNRWDAAQEMALAEMLAWLTKENKSNPFNDFQISTVFSEAWGSLIEEKKIDPAFLALMLNLPDENWVSSHMDEINPEKVHQVRRSFIYQLKQQHQNSLLDYYLKLKEETNKEYSYNPEDSGKRKLKNCLLKILVSGDEKYQTEESLIDLAKEQYIKSNNMTDSINGLQAVVNSDGNVARALLADFYQKWRHEPLVVDKWFTLQATSTLPNALQEVKKLCQHPAFSMTNPNKVRALIGAFAGGNQNQFHSEDGQGYRFLSEKIRQLDKLNPQMAARLIIPMTNWRKYNSKRQQLMKKELLNIKEQKNLSNDLQEFIDSSL